MNQNNSQAKPFAKTTVMQSVILPNELRIGNLVEFFGIREVIAIKKHKIKKVNTDILLLNGLQLHHYH